MSDLQHDTNESYSPKPTKLEQDPVVACVMTVCGSMLLTIVALLTLIWLTS